MQVKKTPVLPIYNPVLNDNHVLNFPRDLLPIDPSLSLSGYFLFQRKKKNSRGFCKYRKILIKSFA